VRSWERLNLYEANDTSMRLTQTQAATRAAIERLASSALMPIELAARIGDALTVALPNDGYRLFGIDPSTMLVNRLLAASESDNWARREWLLDVYLSADALPYVELPTLMRLGLPVVASQAQQSACWGYPTQVLAQLSAVAHERAFHDLRSPVGGTVLASFRSRGTWMAAMQLYRRDPVWSFTRSDVAFLRSLATLIGDALAAANAREQALSDDADDDDASGIVLINSDGTVGFATPAGESWLDRLRRAEPGIGNDLPTPIAAAVAGLRATARPSQRLIAPLACGPLRIEASPGGAGGAIAIVMSLYQPTPQPEVPVAWPLTPQERQIAGLLAQGKTNKAIAETLFITENTVQTHLRHIYAKLEVTGRTQLLARLFRERAGVHLLNEGVA
jgi:DNA-binding CsgD family transcriptional regulator/GAF domain-containing protein